MPRICSPGEKCEKGVKRRSLRGGEVQVECLPEVATSSKSKNHNLEEKLKIIDKLFQVFRLMTKAEQKRETFTESKDIYSVQC